MASLKLQRSNCLVRNAELFPWSKDHGLIEAKVAWGPAGTRVIFPWSKDHGLIEAAGRLPVPAFAGRFPWSKDHGLIEA